MRRLLILLLLPLRAFGIDDCTSGEKSINLDNGASTAQLTGVVRCIDRDTKKESRVMGYVKGQLEGREKRWWPNGDSIEQDYKAGKRHGEFRKYEQGTLIEISHYVDDHEMGEGQRFSPKTGKLTRKLVRREPDSESTWENFTEAGQLADCGCGLYGSREAGTGDCRWTKGASPLTWFHENGKKRAVIALVDGLRTGLTTTWSRDGELVSEVNFKKGLRDGLATSYGSDGKPSHSTQYVAGEREGDETDFFNDGAKKNVTRWKAHVAQVETDYFQNGSKKFERVRDGEFFTESRFEDDGSLHWRNHYRRRELEGLSETFLPDGGLQSKENYVAGQLEGRRQSFFDNGAPESDSEWNQGHVVWRKTWAADGGLTEDSEFYEDGSRKKK
jgi:antitoxin component YwqK of YwqJK toxin-antitoxin module